MHTTKIALATAALLSAILAFIAISTLSVYNQEVDLRAAIEAKQLDNQSEFDNMWKSIKQAAQVSDREASLIRDVITGYAEQRGGVGNAGLVSAVAEAVPSVNAQTLAHLQNTIVGLRQNWTMRQKELVDLSREHNRLLRRFPSGPILRAFGCDEIDITVVTSSRTDAAFESRQDDDLGLF